MVLIPSELSPRRSRCRCPGCGLGTRLVPEIGRQDGISPDGLLFRNRIRTHASAARLPQANTRHADDPLLVREPGKEVHQTPVRPVQAHRERSLEIEISLSFSLRDEGANVDRSEEHTSELK